MTCRVATAARPIRRGCLVGCGGLESLPLLSQHLMSSNPVAFDVEAAVIQEEEYRSEARKASASASEVLQRPGDAGCPGR